MIRKVETGFPDKVMRKQGDWIATRSVWSLHDL